MAEQWLNVMDAARRLGVHPAVVRHRIWRGQVPSRFTELGREVWLGDPRGVILSRRRGGRRLLVRWSVLAGIGAAAWMWMG